MIYTLTCNPSLDYIASVPEFTCGTVNRTIKEELYPGGKGINVSLVLKNLGVENTAFGFLAGFTGSKLKSMLKERGIREEFIEVKQGLTRINIKIRSREETELNGRGPLIEQEDIHKLYQKLDRLQDGDILVMAGNIPQTLPDTMYRDIMKHLQGKKLKIVVDATKDLLVNVLNLQPFLIKPNHHELSDIFGRSLTTKKQVTEYAKILQSKGARNVLVSMAGEGAVLAAEDGAVYESVAPNGQIVNSVGAGDSMIAGFLAGYLESGSYREAFRMGICTGSASAFSEELATKPQVQALMGKMWGAIYE